MIDARKANHAAAAPAFRIVDEQWAWSSIGERFLTATLIMESGPALRLLEIHGSGIHFRWFADSVDTTEPSGRDGSFQAVAQGTVIRIVALMEHEAPPVLELALRLTCAERGGDEREWTLRYVVAAEEAPETPLPRTTWIDW